jgi:hypothetical protein
MPRGALWLLQGVLEWLHLGHSPAKFLTPYHELVARLMAKGHTHCCELLGHEPSNIIVPFSKDQRIGYGNFKTYGSLHWLIFQDRSGIISCIQKFTVCLLSCVCLSKNYSILLSIGGCQNFH